MRQQISLDIDPDDVVDAVGQSAYVRGAQYVRNGAVQRALWNRAEGALLGTVSGHGGRQYTTAAYFSLAGGASRVFDYGECSCPVGFDCKHVAAVVLAGTGLEERGASPSSQSRQSDWEQALGSLLQPREARSPQRTPLALELTLSHARGYAAPKLLARLMRPGKRGDWIAGDLSWSKLEMLHVYREYADAQLRLLRELYAMSQARSHGYYGYHGEQKTIELSTFESPRLWSILAEAESSGIRLVHGKARLGAVELAGTAEVCLDVTSGESAELRVTPQVRVERGGFDPVPITFVGTEAHGVVLTDRATFDPAAEPGDCKLWLAELAKPVPEQLQHLVRSDARLEIPAAEQERFREEFYPRLRRTAPVVSSDESFTPPVISDPTLTLHAAYGSGHELELSWAWAYQVGESQLSIPVDPVGAPERDEGVRDPEAERALLERADVGLEELGLATTDPQRTLLPQSTLDGIDTMRFTTEVLPLLSEMPDVDVRTRGEQADYREAGDSLRIGVSTDEVAGEQDWFDLGISITVEGEEVPFLDVFTALADDEPYLLCDDGAFFSLEKPELQQLRRLIEEARALQDVPSDQLRISRFQAGLWDELSSLGVVDRQAQAWRRQVEGLLSSDSVPTPLPDGLAGQLRPYQEDGFGWLTFLWQHQLGGVLADDMGLGKTLQTLALLNHARQADPDGGPFLIVAPASVVQNWAAEAERFTPELNVVPVRETLARRGQSLDEARDGADVVVISYTLLRLDFDAYGDVSWSGLVLDEAQFVKNHQSKLYQCARRCQAPFKLAITGTPIENNLMELWSMLSITAPGLFPNPTRFREYYSRPIERGGDAELLAQLRRRIKPLVKRRTKELVAAELPAKQEQVLEVELGSRHRKIYERYLQRERQKVLGLLHDVQRNRFTILRSLTLLRQLSLHPALVDSEYATVPCSKIDSLVEQMREVIDGGHRALVFSQFTGFLDLVRARLDSAGVSYGYLDGKTRKREQVIKNFKEGSDPAFLISLKAGGFGLNLTEADYCFLLDPWWNPATETQAVDRTHRIGQAHGVMVYRLISAGTIEEKVMALKQRKAELFASVMDEGDAFGAALQADDIRALFE